MKLIAKFLNLIMWVVSFCLATLAEMGVWDLAALPSGTEGMISPDPNSESVSYFDTFRFWGNDLKSSVTREPRYAVRGWFGAPAWWQKGMKWADNAVEFVVGAAVPLAAPTYEINEISRYCDFAKTGFALVETNAKYDSENNQFTTAKVAEFTGAQLASDFTGTLMTLADKMDTETVDLWKIGSSAAICDRVYINVKKDSPVYGFEMGDANTRKMYNVFCKIAKYNAADYIGWITKFYKTSEDAAGNKALILGSDGKPEMKGSVVGLYFQFYMALIFAFFFVHENPIVVERQTDGTNSVSGGMHMHWTHKKKKTKEDKESK